MNANVSPVHFVHLVHPLEAETDAPLAIDSAIDLALLQPGLIGAAHAAAALRQLHTWLNLHAQVIVVEVWAGHNANDPGRVTHRCAQDVIGLRTSLACKVWTIGRPAMIPAATGNTMRPREMI